MAKRSDPSTREQLVVLPTGAGEPKRLPRGPLAIFEGVAFTADGRRIVVVASEQGQRAVRRLYIQDLDGGDPRAITPPNTDFARPMAPVSPDGHSVFANEGGTWRIFPVDGGAPREIPGLQQGDRPLRWSTDRRLLVSRLVGESRATIHAIDLADGTWQQLHDIRPADPAGVSRSDRLSVAMSPDGRSYVYSYVRRFSQLFVVDGLR